MPRAGRGFGSTNEGAYVSLSSELDWLLNDLVSRVVHIEKAAVLSRDGLTMGASSGLTKEDADHLSAVAAGFRA